MKKVILASIISLVASGAIASEAIDKDRAIGAKDGRTAEQVIAAIDSSDWKVNPEDYGMTAMEYQQGEAELLFGGMQKRAGGINKFFYFPTLVKAADRFVVSPNNDTLYSLAVIDARKGFTITVPDVGERFISLHLQDFNHTFVDYNWTPGEHTFKTEDIDTDYVILGMRVGSSGTEEDQKYIREQIQPKTKIDSASAIAFKPKYDPGQTAGYVQP